MRLVLALVLVLAALPSASAAALGLPAGRTFEAALAPGGDVAFDVPVEVGEDGALYAKLLPTEGNAVTDGARHNGSVQDGTGWRVSFALVRGGAAPLDLGSYADGNATPLVTVRAGEALALRVTVHAPADALRGGLTQHVYVAIALRAGAQDLGGTSGASQDTARAVTLTVHLSGGLPPPGGDLPDVGPVDGLPDPSDGSPPDESTPDPTDGAPTTVTTALQLPMWWLVSSLILLGAIAAGVGVLAYVQWASFARTRRTAGEVRVPIDAPRGEKVPVSKER